MRSTFEHYKPPSEVIAIRCKNVGKLPGLSVRKIEDKEYFVVAVVVVVVVVVIVVAVIVMVVVIFMVVVIVFVVVVVVVSDVHFMDFTSRLPWHD